MNAIALPAALVERSLRRCPVGRRQRETNRIPANDRLFPLVPPRPPQHRAPMSDLRPTTGDEALGLRALGALPNGDLEPCGRYLRGDSHGAAPPVHYPFLDALLSLLGSAGESGWLAQLETMAPSMDTSALPASFSCGSYGRRSTKWRPVCRAWSPARLDPSRDSGSILEGREALRLWSESPRPTHATEVDVPCRSEA